MAKNKKEQSSSTVKRKFTKKRNVVKTLPSEEKKKKRVKYSNALKQSHKEVHELVTVINMKPQQWRGRKFGDKKSELKSQPGKGRKFEGETFDSKQDKEFKHEKSGMKTQHWMGKTFGKPWMNRASEDETPNLKFRPWKASSTVSVPKEKLARYKRGEGLSDLYGPKIKRREAKIEFAAEQSARAELLLPEESGFLIPDEGEMTRQFTQKQIQAAVDITSATKHFDLHLEQFGPYRMNYSRNGRHLLLGGKRGHLAAMDWVTKNLHCEVNAMEAVYDVRWLHIETMFAVAQKEWVFMYDNQGIELHCIKSLHRILRMEFLPYHFLLSTASSMGYLSWLDVSIGEMVSQFNTNLGRLNIMALNPYNAVVCLGNAKGVVSMWSPNERKPLCQMLCHEHPIQGLAIDPQGQYMATSGADRSLRIWDIRMLEGPLQKYKLRAVANNLSFSQRGLLAVGMGNMIEIYRNCCKRSADKPYLLHRSNKRISNMEFCPYEDVLGIGTEAGFTSLIIPGSGEPNFDALESNPFQNKSQRREAEVKYLLDKVQPEFIMLDPTVISEVNIPSLKERIEAKTKLFNLKTPKIDFEPRKKSRKRGSVHAAKTKKIVQEESNKEFVRQLKKTKEDEEVLAPQETPVPKTKPASVLDRFKPKPKIKIQS